ncbi:MAG TPA: hypothetical protein VHB79_26085 [Polyangiaceae bacterium]|nr:hypothetical protein [Polyangiaceae bacterium]
MLYATMPGALMYRRCYPAGVPDTHSIRTAHLSVAAAGTAFANVPADERAAVFESLSKTFRRSEYHRLRFDSLRREVDARRDGLPGEVFWDEFVETLHFELQAFCGAARMVLDELVYLIARRHGVAPKRARRAPWETADLVKKDLPPQCQVLEVELIRKKSDWFDLLNAYRNSFFHHGWRHGTGHYAPGDIRAAARNPAANALLVPDRTSLVGRSKPHERTYVDGTTVDDVLQRGTEGLHQLLRELCDGPWSAAEPPPGTAPRKEHPNLIVLLATPSLFSFRDCVVIPFFTTAELARAFKIPDPDAVELVDIPVSRAVVGKPAISFSLKGLTSDALPPGTRSVKVLIDPIVKGEGAENIECAHAIDVDFQAAIANPTSPMSIPVANLTRLFVWRAVSRRTWVEN